MTEGAFANNNCLSAPHLGSQVPEETHHDLPDNQAEEQEDTDGDGQVSEPQGDPDDSQEPRGGLNSDQALRLLGRYSPWQLRGYLTYAIGFMVPFASMATAIIFIGDTPDYHCNVPDGSALNQSLPREQVDGQYRWSQCMVYRNLSVDNSTIPCPQGYWYSPQSGYESTLVTEWDLVCGRNWLVELSMTVNDIGSTLGLLVLPGLADVVGRQPVFLGCVWSCVVVTVVQAFSPNMVVYMFLSFLDGMQKQGMIATAVVLGIELFPSDQRTFAGTAIQFFWAVGYLMLTPFAYFIRNWRYLQLALIAPWGFSILFYWWLPESIPWLVTNDREDKAEILLKQAAKFNKISLPSKIFATNSNKSKRNNGLKQKKESHRFSCRNIEPRVCLEACWRKWRNAGKDSNTPNKYNYGALALMRSPTMRLLTFAMMFIWFANNLAYRGLNLTVTSLSGNRYLNYFLYGLVEVPAYAVTWMALDKIGRIKPLFAFHMLGGAALIGTVIQTSEQNEIVTPMVTTLTMLGKFAISGSYAVIFCNSVEMFPTNVRNTAFGLCHFSARIAGYISPYFRILARHHPWMPQVILGIISAAAGFTALLLPETRDTHLPDTVEEVESWKRKTFLNCVSSDSDESGDYGEETTSL